MFRRSFLQALIATTALPACANAPERSARASLRPDDFLARSAPASERLVAEANLGGKVGFVVADAETGEPLETLNPIRPQPPASVAKAVTALYALETLGADHRFVTRLLATGPIRGGRLDGDLVLVGSGDPALDTDGLDSLAQQAAAAGIREVGGRLLVADGALPTFARIDRTQPDHVGYNPSISAVNVNFNRVHFSWERSGSGYQTSLDARTDRFRPQVTSAQMVVADRSLPVYTYSQDGAVDRWTVARGQLGRTGSRWLPVRNPSVYAGDILRTMLRRNGISAPAAARIGAAPAGTEVAREVGAPLDRVASSMLRFSNNLTAEVLGLAATVERGVMPPTLNASADLMSSWMQQRSGARRVDFDDHSGLNATTRISAADMITLLTARGARARLEPILREYTIEGDVNVPVRAKTGTLNFVSGLAGYFTTRRGRTLAFATFCSELDRRSGLSVAERERPQGGREWARRARSLQFDLIERWEKVYA